MAKHTQTFDHFVKMAIKGLTFSMFFAFFFSDFTQILLEISNDFKFASSQSEVFLR